MFFSRIYQSDGNNINIIIFRHLVVPFQDKRFSQKGATPTHAVLFVNQLFNIFKKFTSISTH